MWVSRATPAVVASAAAPAAPCKAPLPQGPAVPAPIVFTTGCGGFRLEKSGRLSRLPRGWLAAHGGGTGRRYGDDLQIRRNRAGRIVLLRHGRLLWRSSGLYPNDGGGVAFGPNMFAFAIYRRGVFLTDLRGPERLVVPGRGRNPYDFMRSGRLIVTGARDVVTVLAPDGDVERRYRVRRWGGYSFDAATDTFFFVTPGGRLATLRETRLRVGRWLRGIDGSMSFHRPGLLLFEGGRSLTVTRRDGRLVARARWPRSRLHVYDSGASVSADGRRFAFRLSDARPGASKGAAAVFVLAAGERRARAVYRHRLGKLGCAIGANMRWSGRYLLYGSADGEIAVLDASGANRLSLTRLAQSLPRRSRAERATADWASSYS